MPSDLRPGLAVSDPDLKRLQLLTELAAEERSALAAHLEPARLAPGSVLFDEGEPGEGAVFVRSGLLSLTSSRTPEGVEIGPGSALGALSLVDSGPREVRATAVRDTEVYVLRRSAFRRFRDDEPRAACRLLEAILCESSRLGRAALADPEAHLAPLADDD